MFGKLKQMFHSESLEDKIPLVILKLDTALKRIENVGESLRSEDNKLFERCVEARVKGDTIRAMMYANECAEIRNIARTVVSSKYALEQMVLRLHTVAKLGSILVTISPVIGVIKETKNRLIGIIPNVATNLNEANDMLTKCLGRMGTSTVSGVEPVVYSEAAVKVLHEAEFAAEETIRERFPKIPENIKMRLFKEELLTG